MVAILFFVGIVCLVYFVVCIGYAGVGSKFSWFWLGSSIVLFGSSILAKYTIVNEIVIPYGVKIVATLLLVGASSLFVVTEAIIIYYGNHQAPSDLEYVIILGAQVKGSKVSGSLAKRLDTAIEYLTENPSTRVIVSGGRGPGETISEAQAMSDYLIAAGIVESKIVKEDQSTNTNENIKYSKRVLPKGNHSVGIISNGFHIYRAIRIANKQELASQVYGLAAPTDHILRVSYYVREALAVFKDKLVGNI